MVPRDASETRSPLLPSNRYFINVLFSRDSGMDSALCVIQAPRLSDQCPEGLASQNTISNAGELGVRQSQETRKTPHIGDNNFFVTTSAPAAQRLGITKRIGWHTFTRHFSVQLVRNLT